MTASDWINVFVGVSLMTLAGACIGATRAMVSAARELQRITQSVVVVPPEQARLVKLGEVRDPTRGFSGVKTKTRRAS